MSQNAGFAQVVKQIVGAAPVRRVADEAGISHTALYDMMQGRVPKRALVLQIADRLNLGTATRSALLSAAGYLDERNAAGTDGVGDLHIADVAEGLRRLTPEQLDLVRRLVEEPHRIDTMRLVAEVISGRVGLGAVCGAGSALAVPA